VATRSRNVKALAAVVALGSTLAMPAVASAGERTTPNACMWPDENRRGVDLTLSGEATPESPTAGSTVTLDETRIAGTLPGWVAQEGYTLGIIQAGPNTLPVTLKVQISGTGTVEGTRTVEASATLQFDFDPNGPAPELGVDLALPDSTWTSRGGRIDFAQGRVDISGTINNAGLTFFSDCRPALFNASFDHSWITAVPFETVARDQVSFSDVGESHPFRSNIHWLVAEGIASGYDDGTFRPSAVVSRQAVASFLYRMAGSPAFTLPAAPTFIDVGIAHPFYAAIEWAVAEGIVAGYDDGTFRPTAVVSRQAAAAFLHRNAGSPTVEGAGTSFSDVGPSHPFAAAIQWMADNEVAGGYDDGTYGPGRDVSRQAVAAFISRLP
jgi:hypothetical protein